MVAVATGGAVLVLLVATALLASAAVEGWRQRDSPTAAEFAARPLALACGVAAAGAVALAGTVAVAPGQRPFTVAALVVGLLLPVPWFLFALEYTGRNDLVSGQTTALVVTPAALGLLASGVIFGSQFLPGLSLPRPAAGQGLLAAVAFVLSTVQALSLLSCGGMMLVATLLLVVAFQRHEYLDSTTGALLGVFGTVPWLSLLLGLIGNAVPVTAAVGFLVGGAAVAVVVRRGRLFPTVAAAGNVGPETVMRELEDPVVVADSAGSVVELNATAERRLSVDERPAGKSVADVLDAPIDELRTVGTLELATTDGRRLFAPSVSELTDQHDHCLGYAVVLRDVTERETREQRLEVLNRVLRHNLRNDTTVLLAHAQKLASAVDDPTLADSAATIEETASELTDVSERARELESLLSTPVDADARVAVEPLCVGVLADHDGEGSVHTAHDVPEELVAEGSEELLRAALETLVEEAIDRGEDATEVRIDAARTPARDPPVRITVTDDAPTISEQDRRAVLAGEETSLQHSSGLGLWLVRWVTTRLGGTLDIQARDGGGTAVTLQVPGGRQERTGLDGRAATTD